MLRQASNVPLLAGCRDRERGDALARARLSSAEILSRRTGGRRFLSLRLASPLPQVRFCPTGGITPGNASAYLALPNVITIGGSWMAPKKLLAAKDWAAVEVLLAPRSYINFLPACGRRWRSAGEGLIDLSVTYGRATRERKNYTLRLAPPP